MLKCHYYCSLAVFIRAASSQETEGSEDGVLPYHVPVVFIEFGRFGDQIVRQLHLTHIVEQSSKSQLGQPFPVQSQSEPEEDRKHTDIGRMNISVFIEILYGGEPEECLLVLYDSIH